MKTVTTHEIYWLAGLLDGEGCFQSGNYDQPKIQMKMCDYDIVARAAELLHIGHIQTVLPLYEKPSKSAWGKKIQYRVDVGGRKAAGWMMTLYPIMGARRRGKIREVLRKWRRRGTKNTAPRQKARISAEMLLSG